MELLGHHGVKLGTSTSGMTQQRAADGAASVDPSALHPYGTGQSSGPTSLLRNDTAHTLRPESQTRLDPPLSSYVNDTSINVASGSTAHAFESRGNSAFPHHHQPPLPTSQTQQRPQSFANNQSPDQDLGESLVRHTTVLSPADEPSHGTLVISSSGRSKYLGPSAASEWLKDASSAIYLPSVPRSMADTM